MPRNKPFDIPQELRQLAEENVERARQLYLQFIESVAQTMAVWGMPPSDTITPGFNRVRARAVGFAKENADAAFKLGREIANAKDLQELLSLQNSVRSIANEMVCGSNTRVWAANGRSVGQYGSQCWRGRLPDSNPDGPARRRNQLEIDRLLN